MIHFCLMGIRCNYPSKKKIPKIPKKKKKKRKFFALKTAYKEDNIPVLHDTRAHTYSLS
jgi:hypothetical protein